MSKLEEHWVFLYRMLYAVRKPNRERVDYVTNGYDFCKDFDGYIHQFNKQRKKCQSCKKRFKTYKRELVYYAPTQWSILRVMILCKQCRKKYFDTGRIEIDGKIISMEEEKE